MKYTRLEIHLRLPMPQRLTVTPLKAKSVDRLLQVNSPPRWYMLSPARRGEMGLDARGLLNPVRLTSLGAMPLEGQC